MLEEEYFRSNYEIRSMLRALFNSDFFKSEKVRFARVKSPAEVVVSTLHLIGDFKFPKDGIYDTALECRYMNQDLLNPPSVEGWHTGKEWIDSGALVERINFAAGQVGDLSKPGVQRIIEGLCALGPTMTAEQLVDSCLDLVGPLEVSSARRDDLINHVQRGGEVRCGTEAEKQAFENRVAGLLPLIVSTREFQFA